MGSKSRDRILDYLKDLIAKVTGVEPSRIQADEDFEAYGIDSIMVMTLNEALDERVTGLPRTLFFEYRTISDLADYFEREHAGAFGAEAAPELAPVEEPQPAALTSPPPDRVEAAALGPAPTQADEEEWLSVEDLFGGGLSTQDRVPPAATGAQPARSPDIAIIGLDGRYPMARNLDEFWDNLLGGRDCITEVPGDRWNHAALFAPDRNRDDKVYSKWGGFLDDVDRFEPLFFNISPREAENMDPQERIFLETAWKTFEDAGYTRERLKGTGVGVFVGVMWSQYQLYGVEETLRGRLTATSSSFASVANRVSFHFDIAGPSIALDTMCSSSLTAIHWACRSLLERECDMALAGGVNLTLHPNKYIHLSRGQFAASDGRCRAFGEGGDGYVPGEGVGAVLLKPLELAEKDGDQIYGVIKATAINHGGKTNGYTVPNPNAQARVIRQALDASGIDAADIGYLEAHGTGTSLGDPIEMSGLMASLGKRLEEAGGHCALGSVKSNIGHLESASGIAGLTKVLLQMRHGRLVPTLHVESLNPNIDWDSVPFRVQRTAAAWHPLSPDQPLRAGLSSFGAGGANAHLIVESYRTPPAHEAPGPQLVILSAETEDHLRRYARALAGHLAREPRPTLVSVAHTLQTGREAMAERLALVVDNLDGLKDALERFADGDQAGMFRGRVDAADFTQMFTGDAAADFLRRLSEERDWPQLARLWVMGCQLDWNELHGGNLAPTVSLPGYPFAGKRYWAAQEPAYTGEAAETAEAAATRVLLKPEWQLQDPPLAAPIPKGRLLVLTDATGKAIGANLFANTPGLSVVIERGDLPDAAAGEQAAKRLLDAAGTLVGIVDLCDLEARGPTPPWGRVALLQQLIAGCRNDLGLLHVTRGCVPFESEGGGGGDIMRGLVAMLSAEYRHVRAGTLDLDVIDARTPALLEQAWASVGAEGQLCYRKGRHYRMALVPCPETKPAGLRLDPDKVYMITGGTGGIGLQVAAWLAERGATKLLLTGMRPLPPKEQWPELLAGGGLDQEQAQKIRAIAALPADVDLYFGPLDDQGPLADFLKNQSQSRGPVGGVIHCAGTVRERYPAFIEKPVDDMAAVLEPKVAGLNGLRSLLEGQPLDFFVLCSSVCALAPSLAVGVCDYAAANGYMNLVAQRDWHGGKGIIQALVWPNWSQVGLGETRSPRYGALGLLGIENSEGLSLLEQCLGIPEPVVVPLLIDPRRFDPEALTRLHPEPRTVAEPREPVKAPAPAAAAPKPQAGGVVDKPNLVVALQRELAPVLRIDPEEWKASATFESLGVDSVLIASINRALEAWLGESLDPGMLLEYPSLETLSDHLLSEQGTAVAAALGTGEAEPEPAAVPPTPQYVRQDPLPEPPAPPSDKPAASSPVRSSAVREEEGFAVIGMACRFPQSPNLTAFRENLYRGFDGIREVPSSRWEIEHWYHPNEYQQGKSISKWGGFVDDVELFDPLPFDLDETVAPHVDPLLRMALETSIEALHDAGYSKQDVNGRSVAVFMGSRVANYGDRIPKYEKNSVVATGQVFFAALLSHVLNLKGPAFVLDSACSSSLLSIHQACRSLADGEAEMALAGGVDFLLDERPYLMLSEARALSPTGRCRTFDGSADGFVPGEGCGMIVLKRLSRALADGDRIYALVEGSAINNDGRTMGITTPNPEQQQAVIRSAWQRAGADPATIGYMETHGTGTRIGDPIELKALTAVLGGATDERGYCAIGSVKSNFGHLLSAAGVAAFIKTALCIHGRTLVPTLHCKAPNPRFAFADSPFYPNDGLRPWEPRQGDRRAGITALGFGGTNVHLVVSDAHLQQAGYAPRRNSLEPAAYERRRHWLSAPASGSHGVPQTYKAASVPAVAQPIAGYSFKKRY